MISFYHKYEDASFLQQSLETIIILFQIKCKTVETWKTAMVGVYKCIVCRGPNPKYSFPKDEKTLEKWMKLLNLKKKPNWRAKLCEKHFRFSDLYITNEKNVTKWKKEHFLFVLTLLFLIRYGLVDREKKLRATKQC